MENQIEVKTNKGIEYIIRRKNGFEYIFVEGKLIIYEPFYFVARETTSINGQDYILVHRLNNKMNYVGFDGEFLLADDSETEIDPYAKNNLIRVRERGLMNFAKTTDGELLFWFRKIEDLENSVKERKLTARDAEIKLKEKYDVDDLENVLPHRRVIATDFDNRNLWQQNGECVTGEFPQQGKIHDNVEYCTDTQRFEYIEYFIKDEEE